MAEIAKLIRLAKIHSSPVNYKSIQNCNPFRYYSECGDGGDDTGHFLPTKDDNPNAPTMYDVRKFGHQLPSDSITPYFEALPEIPTGVFRCTEGEMLGCGAGKCAYYQNPEYFSYHHMSFFDFHLHLRKHRLPCAKTGRKPP
ncbi:uncharacterized protein LOC142973615 [Anticarsia gemmatalis]|uniref:uncharacterized protein LOC142973615 n=1 Tax=Anticarsia gemmatalis TaxID=129554 RepID=UPI003F772D53